MRTRIALAQKTQSTRRAVLLAAPSGVGLSVGVGVVIGGGAFSMAVGMGLAVATVMSMLICYAILRFPWFDV